MSYISIAAAAGGSGTVTSVGQTINSGASSGIFTVTGSPVIAAGTLDIATAGTSGGVPYFSSGTVVSSSGVLAANALVKGGGAGVTPASSSVATDDGTTLTYTGTGGVLSTTSGGLKAGANGGAAGVLSLNGSTSGAATITAPAVAGTSTNALALSNVISLPDGATATPAILINDVGFYRSTTTTMRWEAGGTDRILFNTSSMQPVSANAINLGAVGAFFASSFFNQLNIVTSANSAQWNQAAISEQITLNTGGTTTDSAANLLPANAIIEAVVARITTTITTAANWSLGDATTGGRFMAANSTLTSGTTAIGLQHQQGSVATDAAGPVQTAAAKLRITTNANPGAGVIRVTVFYRTFVAPTS